MTQLYHAKRVTVPKLVTQDGAARLRRRALQGKKTQAGMVGHKSVVFAGEFYMGERRYDGSMDELRAKFHLAHGRVRCFPAGGEFHCGANAFASVARTGEKRQFAGHS